jgi:hypothetical protein
VDAAEAMKEMEVITGTAEGMTGMEKGIRNERRISRPCRFA